MATSSEISRFLARLPEAVAARFDAEQLAAVELHFGMRNRVRHVVDWRRRIKFGRLSGYVVILAGRDRAGD